MRVYRLAASRFAATREQAFLGEAGLRGDGRWHTTGRRIAYTAQSLSLAVLERLAHLERASGVEPHVIWKADIPDDLIASAPDLPSTWRVDLRMTRSIGDQWLANGKSPALSVPSILVDEEQNILLNPTHSSFSLEWVAAGPLPFRFDLRLV